MPRDAGKLEKPETDSSDNIIRTALLILIVTVFVFCFVIIKKFA